MFLLDTNVLVYAFDTSDSAKHQRAQQLLEQATQSNDSGVSSQVIQEFCNVALKKFEVTFTTGELLLVLEEILLPLWRHLPSPDFYKNTIRLAGNYQLSFYDALIVQAALDLDCDTLYSEDLQAGQQFGKLSIVNPFAASNEKGIK